MSGFKERVRKTLGEPGTGVHKYRVANVAIVDVIMTIIAAIVLAKIFNANTILILIVLFVIGIIAHRYFEVRTTVDKLLFDK